MAPTALAIIYIRQHQHASHGDVCSASLELTLFELSMPDDTSMGAKEFLCSISVGLYVREIPLRSRTCTALTHYISMAHTASPISGLDVNSIPATEVCPLLQWNSRSFRLFRLMTLAHRQRTCKLRLAISRWNLHLFTHVHCMVAVCKLRRLSLSTAASQRCAWVL